MARFFLIAKLGYGLAISPPLSKNDEGDIALVASSVSLISQKLPELTGYTNSD
jgi:hypothetical protein